MSEKWKPIPNYEDAYEASNYGRVRSLRVAGFKYNIKRSEPLDLTLKFNRATGYHHIDLSKNGIKKRFTLNRLICLTFNGPPPFADAEAAHLDGNKTNNKPENLEWVTSKVNHSHRELHGTMYRGEQHPSSILTAEQVRKIRKEYNGTKGQIVKWGKEIGVNYYTISQALRGKRWKSITNPPPVKL